MSPPSPALWGWRATAAVALISGLAAVAILEIVQYPFPISGILVFHRLLFRQDLAGLLLLVALAVLACIPATHAPALRLIAAIGRRPWLTAAITFVALCLGILLAAHNHPLANDEHLMLMQSRIFAEGRLTGQYPPELLPWLMPDYYRYRWIMLDEATGEIAATYWPAFALLLAPFSALGIPWVCNPLLTALGVALIGRLAASLTREPAAAGWSMIFALASPGFSSQGLTYFAMSAHLLVNLVFAALLLERTPRRLFAAGLVGSFALLLHNPVPHILFALPWIVSLAWEPGARRRLLPLVLGYLPALVIGLAWAAFLRAMHGFILFAVFPHDDDPLHILGNFLWYWHFRLGMVFGAPTEYSLGARIGELVRFWSWAAPGLPLLAAAGWWLARREQGLRLLGASFAVTLGGYFLVSFDQGYGWGARYLHPAFGGLPILAAVAMTKLPQLALLRGWVAAAAVLSLVFATALRWWQIHDYIDEHLSRRPPYAPGERQLVVVHYDRMHYTQDLVQNDPFLRSPVLFLLSRGRQDDYSMIRERFPTARQVSEDWRGQVWRLD